MKALLILIILLFNCMAVMSQPVRDVNGITGQVTDLHINKIYKVTYAQVVFDFDSVTWGVYFLPGKHEDACKVVSEGNLLKMKTGSAFYPMSDEWQYITAKQHKNLLKYTDDAAAR